MKKTIATAGLTMLALLAGGIASAQGDGKAVGRNADRSRTELVSRLDAQFARLDTNRDGYVSQAERSAVRDTRIADRFKRLDADKNGSLTLAEFKAGREHREGASAGRGDRRGHHGMRGGGGRHGAGAAGRTLDADKDGRISKAEFQAAALARFDRADADRNGVVTSAERQAARAAMKGPRSR